MDRNPRKRPLPRKERRPLFDIGAVIQYCLISVVFAFIVYGVNTVVLSAINASPTKQVGNGVLTLFEVHNTGVAFNMLAGHTEIIITASLLAIAVLASVVVLYSARLNQSAISALSFLTSGIAMNTLDRAQYGYVIDYISCNFAPNFPVFNTADMMIVVGAMGLIFALLSRN